MKTEVAKELPEVKVSFEQIDKLGEQSPVKAIWKGFLFHYFNNPKIILAAAALALAFILLLIHPGLFTPAMLITGFIKLKNFCARL